MYNYHVPSIRWIEEYGLVKGLGNLHTRFGYNSAFLCIQALFSFAWIYPASMHSMNGYIWTVMAISSIVGLCWFEEREFGLSDVLSILLLILLLTYGEMQEVCGPNTDFFAFCLVAYVFIHWCKLYQAKEDSIEAYGLLAMLGLYGMTLKLSDGMLFLFAVKPLCQCIKEKKYMLIGKFVLLGVLIVAPYLCRSVLITGYLIYPIASIDLFPVDWKMPKSVIISDSKIITLFARSNGQDYRYEYWTDPFFKWFNTNLNLNFNIFTASFPPCLR